MTNLIGTGPGLFSEGYSGLEPFIWRLYSPVFWFSAMAAPAAPTSAEFESAIDLRHMLTGVAGFRLEREIRERADVQLNAMVQRPGASVKFTPSALSFREDLVDQTIREYLHPGAVGYVGLLPYGRVTDKRMESWPSLLLEPVMDDNWKLGVNEPATFTIPVAITGLPELDAVIP